MMQNLRFVLGLFCLIGTSLTALAQAGDYSLTVSSGTYTPLGASADTLFGIENADDAIDVVPIGFNFTFDGLPFDTLYACSNGFISFNSATGTDWTNDLDGITSDNRPLIAPLWDDLASQAPGSVSRAYYETTGSSPNRVFTFEWENWEWNLSANTGTVSFQVKLYESTNEVEFHYDLKTTPNSPSASIGLTGANTFLSVSGISAGAITTSNTVETTSIDSVVTGQILTFTPPVCPSPGFLSFTNVSTDSVTLNFAGSGSGPWHINWGPAGFIQGSPTTNFDTTSVDSINFNGLMSSTSYDFYIQEDCGTTNGTSNWSGPHTVQTLCAAFTAPYTQSFDGSTTPICWSQSNTNGGPWEFTGSTNSVQCSAAPDHTGNGGSYAWMDQSGGDDGVILEGPEVDVSGLTVPYLEFYYWMCGAGYSPPNMTFVEAWDGANWARLDSIGSATNGWELQAYDLTGFTYNSGMVKIRFRAESGGSGDDYWGDNAIDDVTFMEQPTCALPTQLTVVSISLDSVVVSWSSSETAFNVEYGVSPYSVGGSGTSVSVSDTFAVLTNLSASTTYDFYVQTDCGANGLSSYTLPISFTTPCAPVTAPYTENFDGTTWGPLTTYDACWTATSNSAFIWQVEDQGTGSGDTGPDNDFSGTGQFAYTEATSGGTGDTAYILSPFVDISALSAPYLYFKYHMYGSNMGTLNVDYYDGVQWQNGVFTISGEQQASGSDAWSDGGVNIGGLTRASDTIQIRFSGIKGNGFRSDMSIDEVRVAEAPACPAPQFDSINVIDAFSARFDWTSFAGASNVEWGPAGFIQGSGTGGSIINNTTGPDTLSGLTPNTCYDIYFQDTCSVTDVSVWIGPYTFCTPVTCPAPTALGIDPTLLTINSASLLWTSGGANSFEVEYDSVGFALGTGNSSIANSTTLNISSLNPGTEYEFYVRDICGPNDSSTWSGPFSFTTAFITNYLNDFDVNGLPFAWLEAGGQLTSNTQFTGATSDWTSDNFANIGGGQNSQKVNIWLGNQYEWLISPSIYLDPSITNLQVEFDAAITDFGSTAQGYLGSDDTLALVISTDNGDTWSNTNILWSVSNNDTVDAAGEHFVIPLTGYSGYVRFGLYGGSTIDDTEDNDVFVDHFEVRTPRACTSPTGLMVSNIGTDSALVSWTAGDISAVDWSVIYTLGNQPASMGTVVNSTNDSLVLNNLLSATNYCVYIVEQCATGFSDTIGPVCYSTECNTVSLPYTESFSNSLGCFSAVNGGTTSDTWMWISDYFGSTLDGTPFAFVDSDGAGPGNLLSEILVSVDIDASNISGPLTLEYDHYYLNIGIDSGFVEIYDGNTWTTLVAIGSTIGGWNAPDHDSLDITAYASANMKVRFRYEDNNEYAWYWAVDNINIYEGNSCAASTALMVNNISCDSATVSWTSDPNSTYSQIEYGLQGFTQGTGTFLNGVTSPVTLTSLGLNTDYEFYVIDSCGNSLIVAGPVSFKTDSIGPLVASFTSSQTSTTLTDADVDFDASASTNAVDYSWTFGNSSSGVGVNPSSNYTSNGTYDVTLTVTDKCGNTDDTTVTISVGGISIVENVYNAKVDMYPNPSAGVFRVNVSNGASDYTVEVMDLSGKVIYRSNALSVQDEHAIDLGSKARGMYTVRFVGEGLNVSRRLMIK